MTVEGGGKGGHGHGVWTFQNALLHLSGTYELPKAAKGHKITLPARCHHNPNQLPISFQVTFRY